MDPGCDQDEDAFSPIMLETDPRVSHLLPSIHQVPFPVDGTRLLKRSSRRETELFELAGEETAMPIVSRIGRIGNNMVFQEEAVLIKRGTPLDPPNVRLGERKSISLQITALVSRLHAKGIVHGNINPGVLQWDDSQRLVFADLSCAWRFFDDQGGYCWDGDDEFVSPRLKASTRPGRCFKPTQADDLYAMAVTIWCVWAGQYPEPGMFNQNDGMAPDLSVISDPEIFGIVADALQQGGLNLDLTLPHPILQPPEPSPRPSSLCIEGQTGPASPIEKYIPVVGSLPNNPHRNTNAALQRIPEKNEPVELPAEVPSTDPAQASQLPTPPRRVLLLRHQTPSPTVISSSQQHPPNPHLQLHVTTTFPSRPSTPSTTTSSQSVPPSNHSSSSSSPSLSDKNDDDDDDDDDDDLDEEITWEFPFPFRQGLPCCSPTDSVACLASPKGPPPPEFAVRVSPEQLKIQQQQHPRVRSMISMAAGELDSLDDSVAEVGWWRWGAVSNRARAARSLSAEGRERGGGFL